MQIKTLPTSAKFPVRHTRALAGLVLCLIAAGCARPLIQSSGPAFREPSIEPGHVVLSDGYRLPLSRWLPGHPAKAVVLALHGFNDYRRAFHPLGTYLATRGVATYAYDQRGFGASPHRGIWPGSQRLVSDALEVAQALKVRHPHRPLYIVGESMGGAVAMIAATRPASPELTGVVLLAPAVWGRETMGPIMRMALWLSVRTVPGRQWTGEGLDIQPTDNLDALRRMARDPLVLKRSRTDALWGLTNLMDWAMASAPELRTPHLVLYGLNDQVIPRGPTCRMLATLPETGAGSLRVYPEGYHLLLLDKQADRVLSDIHQWIGGPARVRPQGGGRLADSAAREALCADQRPAEQQPAERQHFG